MPQERPPVRFFAAHSLTASKVIRSKGTSFQSGSKWFLMRPSQIERVDSPCIIGPNIFRCVRESVRRRNLVRARIKFRLGEKFQLPTLGLTFRHQRDGTNHFLHPLSFFLSRNSMSGEKRYMWD